MLELAKPLQPKRLPLRAGNPEPQSVDRYRVRCFSKLGCVIGEAIRIAVEALHGRLADLGHGRNGRAHLLSHGEVSTAELIGLNSRLGSSGAVVDVEPSAVELLAPEMH